MSGDLLAFVFGLGAAIGVFLGWTFHGFHHGCYDTDEEPTEER